MMLGTYFCRTGRSLRVLMLDDGKVGKFEPSPEMVEAGARAAVAAGLIDAHEGNGLIPPHGIRAVESILRASLNRVLLDPCPTCGNPLDDTPSAKCWTCDGSRTVPVWAWLRAAQNSGVMEQEGEALVENGRAFDWKPNGTAEWAPYPCEVVPLFRVSVPSTPEES